MRGKVRKVVVSYRDRLCRIAFDLLEFICNQNYTELVVHNKDHGDSDEKEIFLEDLMAIVNIFSFRLYGKEQFLQGNPIQKSSKNQVVVKLLLVQMKILSNSQYEDIDRRKEICRRHGKRKNFSSRRIQEPREAEQDATGTNVHVVREFVHTEELSTSDVKVCALDMREITFGAIYDPDGTIAAIGTKVSNKIHML